MVKIPILLTLVHVRSHTVVFGNPQRRTLLCCVLMNKPSQWLFRVCQFLPLSSCRFECGVLLSHVKAPRCFWSSLGLLHCCRSSRRQRGPVPFETLTTWFLAYDMGECFSRHPATFYHTVKKTLVWGVNLSYKCHNIEGTSRPTLLVNQTCINWPKPIMMSV